MAERESETKLLPCPFCGGTAGVLKALGVSQACCADPMCPANGAYDTHEESVRVWNTRAALSQPSGSGMLFDEVAKWKALFEMEHKQRDFERNECDELRLEWVERALTAERKLAAASPSEGQAARDAGLEEAMEAVRKLKIKTAAADAGNGYRYNENMDGAIAAIRSLKSTPPKGSGNEPR